MLHELLEKIEQKRVQNHLRFVEETLRSKDTTYLSKPLQKKRHELLQHLHEYWTQGKFPQNTRHVSSRESYFVDDANTPCAMGYLMLCDGQKELVEKVRNTNNHVHLSDLTHGEVLDWIKQSGFTQEEAALVQPTYGYRQPYLPYSPFTSYLPWIIGGLTFIFLEILSFQLLDQPLEHTRGKRIMAVAYYTFINLIISTVVGILAQIFLPSLRYRIGF